VLAADRDMGEGITKGGKGMRPRIQLVQIQLSNSGVQAIHSTDSYK
jgi:hypothetical protein